MKVNIGCPDYCKDWVCVDLYPRDPRVVNAEGVTWLRKQYNLEAVVACNLIEHLPSVGDFFFTARQSLREGGELTIVTDNAEWLPFYVPLINILGWGAHSSRKYRPILDKTTWPQHDEIGHFCVFTKLHLENLAHRYGFRMVECKRIMFGARLKAVMVKCKEDLV